MRTLGAALLAARLLAIARARASHDGVAGAVLSALRPGVARERSTELRGLGRFANGERRRLARRHFAHRPRQLGADQRSPMQGLVLATRRERLLLVIGRLDSPLLVSRRGLRGGGARRGRTSSQARRDGLWRG